MVSPIKVTREQIKQTIKQMTDYLWFEKGNYNLNIIGIRNSNAGTEVTNKFDDKMYYKHSGYIGNLKSINFAKLQAKRPEQIIEKAVKGMMPKNRLGNAMIKKLHVYQGPEHNHHAQKPVVKEI